MLETKVAYTAGVVDSDGSISLGKQKNDTYRAGYSYALRVNVGNTDLVILQWLVENFGGTICAHKRKPAYPNWKTLYRWQIANQQALGFLQAILPYLIIKRNRAEIAISFQQRRRKSGKKGKTSFELERDKIDYELMAQLNRRGL